VFDLCTAYKCSLFLDPKAGRASVQATGAVTKDLENLVACKLSIAISVLWLPLLPSPTPHKQKSPDREGTELLNLTLNPVLGSR